MIVTVTDLSPFIDTSDSAKVQAMIEDVEARAFQAAPCLRSSTDEDAVAVARAIIRQAIIRWSKDESGALTQRQQTSGPFMLGESFDTRQQRKGMFLASELADLAALCPASGERTVHVGWLA